MKKSSKKIIAVTLMFSVFFAGLFCCCLTKLSFAEPVVQSTETVVSHCHGQAEKKANVPSGNQECECETIVATLDAHTFDFLKLKAFFAFLADDFIVHKVSLAKFSQAGESLDKHPPPIAFKRAIPFYLEYSILRI